MQDFTIGDLGVFIGTIGGVITSILVILQKSRCVKVDFCGCHCVRDINELKKEERNKKEKDNLNSTIEDQFQQLEQTKLEKEELQDKHDDLKDKHDDLKDKHNDLKEKHETITMEVKDTDGSIP